MTMGGALTRPRSHSASMAVQLSRSMQQVRSPWLCRPVRIRSIEVANSGYTTTYSNSLNGSANCTNLNRDQGRRSTTCTVTNNDKPATLTVIKTVVNDDGGTGRPSDWTMKVVRARRQRASMAPPAGRRSIVDAGTYHLTESGGPATYDVTFGQACNCRRPSRSGCRRSQDVHARQQRPGSRRRWRAACERHSSTSSLDPTRSTTRPARSSISC